MVATIFLPNNTLNSMEQHMKSPLKIAIAGASGRMGRTLIEAVIHHPETILVGAFDRPNSDQIGRDAGDFMGQKTGVLITHSVESAIQEADALIDFTQPEASLNHLQVCCQHQVKAIIGTTGFTPEAHAQIHHFSQTIGIVFAPNMAVGVNATFKLLEVAAKILSSGYDIEIIEAHHNKKVDAPSGTALKMGEVIANQLNINLNQHAVFARQGITGAREPNSIGFSTIRGGDIVGDHTVLFAGLGERIEITHKSSSRMTYAQGAIRAAQFLTNKPYGLFDMQDVLGLKQVTV